MLHAESSYALNPLLPSSDSSFRVRPACCSSSRSVSMSLPRYHQVEMPMPAPTSPIIEFSCQKQPVSLTTARVNRFEPAAAATSESAMPLQSALRNPPPVPAACSVGFAGSAAPPHATRVVETLRATASPAIMRTALMSHVRAQGRRQQFDRVDAWVAGLLAAV